VRACTWERWKTNFHGWMFFSLFFYCAGQSENCRLAVGRASSYVGRAFNFVESVGMWRSKITLQLGRLNDFATWSSNLAESENAVELLYEKVGCLENRCNTVKRTNTVAQPLRERFQKLKTVVH
jgi:hypothetical protein